MARGRKQQSNGISAETIAALEADGMAVHVMDDAAPPESGHNSAERAETIRDACQEIDEFERQIDGLKAEIKAIIETRIVAGLGIKKRDFALARKLHKLDHDERDGLFDSLRECFAALGIGEQLNWLDAEQQDHVGAD